MSYRLALMLPLFLAFSVSAAECTPRNASHGDLQAHADWVIEGTVTMVLGETGFRGRPKIVIGDAKIIQAKDIPPKGKTFSFDTDQCYLGDLGALQGKAGAALEGKAMRFYGRLYEESPRRRFFYFEPVSKPFKLVTKPVRTKIHRVQSENIVAPGWHRAYSTEGKFSVDLPGPFNDATVHEDGEPSYMLGATDTTGAKFFAVFERAGPRAGMGNKLDQDLQEAGATVLDFNGYQALMSRSILAESDGKWVSNSLRIKVPGGVYVLAIAAPVEAETSLAAKQERFFGSLVMP